MAYNYPPYNPGYNPYNNAYNQMQPYPQNQMMQPAQQMQLQPQQMASQPTQGISPASRPVSNREEAVAAQIPFDGSISVFTDVKHGKIYTKMFNFNDGSSIFNTYVLETEKEQEQSEQVKINFATVQDVDYVQKQIEDIKLKIEELKKQSPRKQEKSS